MSERRRERCGHPDLDDIGSAAQRALFDVADVLNVHGSDCLCPPCASRLPALLRRLAASIDAAVPRA